MIIDKTADISIEGDRLAEAGARKLLREHELELHKYIILRNIFHSAIKEVSTKLEILDDEFSVRNDYNPIHHMECRVKTIASTIEKLERRGLEVNLKNIKELKDVAGVRVICKYTDDIYKIADLLMRQDDVTLIERKDYIENPKESGYMSLHLVVLIPVFLAERTEVMPVEIQIRTVAMDTWASLEHELKYKYEGELSEEDKQELKECARLVREIDERMQNVHRKAAGSGKQL